jgi:hypothetical protein
METRGSGLAATDRGCDGDHKAKRNNRALEGICSKCGRNIKLN